ncbi:MAG: ABC transporter permease [Lachnospiraceae bacterium]|nr:ABC transporter permease [Lachnospiraceae bacterium]
MSQFWEFIKIALMNIKSNKGRSVLTMLGIIIGISSVIMIISIGNGVKGEITGELNDMAGGQIYIYSNSNENGESVEFTDEDFELLKERVEHIKAITPNYGFRGTITAKKGTFTGIVSGGTEGLEFSSSDPVIKGKYFTAGDYYSANKVCVVTESGAMKMFGTTNVVGMEIEIDLYGISQDFTIVGIRQDSASSMLNMGYVDENVNVEIPLSVAGSAYGFYVESVSQFLVVGDSAEYSTQMAAECVSLLEARYNVRGQGLILVEDFNDYLSSITSVLGYVTVFVVFVAAISLLVGGIGVMNIMLVSVTERTREIGIRKSLGARTNSILLQFLSESAIITLLGGLIGITIGVLGAFGVCGLLGFSAQVRVSTVLGASVFSSAVGLFFGIYPAKKAAKLSPIEALRHE